MYPTTSGSRCQLLGEGSPACGTHAVRTWRTSVSPRAASHGVALSLMQPMIRRVLRNTSRRDRARGGSVVVALRRQRDLDRLRRVKGRMGGPNLRGLIGEAIEELGGPGRHGSSGTPARATDGHDATRPEPWRRPAGPLAPRRGSRSDTSRLLKNPARWAISNSSE